MKTLANIIDFDRSDFWLNAPLKTVSEADIRNFNSQMGKNYQAYFDSITPHFYNKTTFLRTRGASDRIIRGGAFLPYGVMGAGDNVRTALTAIGNIVDTDNDDSEIYKPRMDDYAIYYELMPVSEYNFNASDIEQNPAMYDNIVTVAVGCTPNTGYTVIPEIGTTKTAIIGQQGITPIPNHNYDNWLVIKNWAMYERALESSSDRVQTGNGSSGNNVIPAVCFDISGAHWYNIASYKSKPRGWTGTSQGVILANLSDARSSWLSLRVLCNWLGVQLDSIEGQEYLFNENATIQHATTLGENIKILVPQSTTELSRWFDYGNQSLFINSTPALNERAILAFKSEGDFLEMLADWGITTRITNDLSEAKKLDGDSFPNSTPGGFVPGGGADSGYNDDPTISAIPSYSDNTSDKIIPITPNVSAINAASTYALSLVDVKTLLNWLMTDNFITNISNLFSDKLSAIDDLKIYPIDLVQHDLGHTQYSTTLTIANVTGSVECYKVLPAYNCILNGGNYHYTAYWGNANDYTSATYFLYVPYAGIIEMSPSHVVNCDLRLVYAVDIMTGSATAIIYSNEVLVKTIPCQIAQTVPITFTNTNQRQIKNALTALNTVNSISNAASGAAMNAAAGNVGGAVSSGSMGLLGLGNAVANTVLTNPLTIGSIGSFSGNTALVMPQTAFLIISRTQLSIPSGRGALMGQPSNISTTIQNFIGSGFVQINVGHINTAATTDEQRQMIELLRNGIFI